MRRSSLRGFIAPRLNKKIIQKEKGVRGTMLIEGANHETWKRLLPGKEELLPVDAWSTFGDCGFTEGSFDEQPISLRLKIAKDIVRQAILVNYTPTINDERVLSGDCLTAAKMFVDYAHQLELPGEYNLAAVCKNPFDPAWRKSTRHLVVLRRDPKTGLYQTIDPAPMVGYGFDTISAPSFLDGQKLTSIGSSALIYEDIAVLTQAEIDLITKVNRARRLWIDGKLSLEECESLVAELALMCAKRSYLGSWYSELCHILAQQYLKVGKDHLCKESLRKAVAHNPLKLKILQMGEVVPAEVREVLTHAQQAFQSALVSRSAAWLREARELFVQDDPHLYPQAIRLLQWGTQAGHLAGVIQSRPPQIAIGDNWTSVLVVNPRLLQSLTTVWVKPSAFAIHQADTAIRCTLSTGTVVWQEEINLSASDAFGYRAIIASYTQGKRNLHDYFGPTRIFLVNGSRQTLMECKIAFREEHARPEGELVEWFDNQPVAWNPWTMNHIHVTDSGAETVLHLLLAYPQYCLINRWCYPHPNL